MLRDPQKRARYDQFGPEGVNGAGGFGAGGMNMDDIFSMFGDIFGGRAGFGGFGGGGRARKPQYRGGDLRLKVRLTLQEIATGVTKKFKVKKKSHMLPLPRQRRGKAAAQPRPAPHAMGRASW